MMRNRTLAGLGARAIFCTPGLIGAIGCSDGLETPVVRSTAALQVWAGSDVGPAWAGGANVTPPTVRVWRISPATVRAPSQTAAPGVAVRFRVTAGDGTVRDTIVVTDQTGFASCGLWTLGQSPGINTVTATVDGVGSVVFTTSSRPRPRIIASYDLLLNPEDTTVSGGQLLLGDDGSLEVSLVYSAQAFIPNLPPVEPIVWTLLTYSIDGSLLSSPSSSPRVYGDVRQDTLFVVRRLVDDDGFYWPLVDTYVRSRQPSRAVE